MTSERRTMAAAASSTVLGTLPVFLLGGLAVLVREDLAFSETQLGAAVTVFFAVSALCSYPAGRTAEQVGAYRATLAAAAISATALVGIAVLARSYAGLLAFLVLAGIGNAGAQLGSNLSLARGISPERQGLAYGVKQSAVPIATLLSGAAVPAIGLTVGWRWAFARSAAAALPHVLLAPRQGAPEPRRRGSAAREGDVAFRPLVVVAVAVGLGAGAANSFGAFLVESAVAGGVPTGTAGLLLSAGSAVGIAARLTIGASADRRDGRHLTVIIMLMAVGAGGMALLAAPGPVALVTGTLLAFGTGWSWPGLLNFAIVRLNRGAPASATGITQTGIFTGGAIGPLLFGATVEGAGYPVAWLLAAAALIAAAGLLVLGRGLLRRDVRHRLDQSPRLAEHSS